MADAVIKEAGSANIIIMAAAVADYKPVQISTRKIKKNSDNLVLKLERTEDILAELGKRKHENQILVGFAAESENLLKNAKEKLRKKNLDWIIANDISQTDAGFQSDYNRVTIIANDGTCIELPLMTKRELAIKILDTVIADLRQ